MPMPSQRTAQIVSTNLAGIVDSWHQLQLADPRFRSDLGDPETLRRQTQSAADLLCEAMKLSEASFGSDEYASLRNKLAAIATQREKFGITPFQVAASFISVKDALIPLLRDEYKKEPELLGEELIAVSTLVDTVTLSVFESMLKRREEVILRQSQEILDLATPVVQIWERVVLAPVIGTLDSRRTQQLMETLLNRIVQTRSLFALVDITGVPSIDTQTAQHLIETVNAVRLLGAQVILTGLRPAIAQSMVHLGVDLSHVVTKASLTSGLQHAIDSLDNNGREPPAVHANGADGQPAVARAH